MVAQTPISGLRLAELTDSPNMEEAMSQLGEDLDSILVPRFATTTARDAAITAPIYGQMCAVTGSGVLWYNGSAWSTVTGQTTLVFKPSDETVNNTTVLQADDHLTVALAANTSYRIECLLRAKSASGSPGLDFNFSFPSGAVFYHPLADEDASSPSATTTGVAGTTVAANITFHAITTGSTAGNLTVNWAQTTATATNTSVLKGSYLMVTAQT